MKVKFPNLSFKAITRTNASSTTNDEPLPSKSQVVICGGGVMGAAVAYHLALAGWGEQTVLIESSRYLVNCYT